MLTVPLTYLTNCARVPVKAREQHSFQIPPSFELMEDLVRHIEAASPSADGAQVLPPELHVEPGAFVWALHEAWAAHTIGDKELAHSYRNLEKWLSDKKTNVPSLHHKLKGRYPLSKGETEGLITVLLTYWKVSNKKNHVAAVEHAPATASKITNILFGPINTFTRKEIYVLPSPGIDGSEFLRRHRSNTAIIIPVKGRALFGPNPVFAINGALFSLRRALSGAGSTVSMVWLLSGQILREGDEFVRYLYDRSFLTTLLQLVRVYAQLELKTPDALPLPSVVELANRLFVCVYAPHAIPKSELRSDIAARELQPKDFVLDSDSLPMRWELEGEKSDLLTTHSITVCASDTHLHYWVNEREGTRIAFREVVGSPTDHVEQAHRLVVSALIERRSSSKKKPATERLRSLGWLFLPAADFLAGADLRIADPTTR
jgi:hypothetical protein